MADKGADAEIPADAPVAAADATPEAEVEVEVEAEAEKPKTEADIGAETETGPVSGKEAAPNDDQRVDPEQGQDSNRQHDADTMSGAEDGDGESDPVKPDPTSTGGSEFADFAQELGAESLPDILEAAAAFARIKDGMPHFPRPYLMRRVAQISNEDPFSREDGLRAFGALLREGTLRRIGRGRFTISEDSRYLTAAR